MPLTAHATFTLDEAAQATIEIAGPESTWVQTSTSAYHMEHSVMVLGLQSDQTYQIVLVATDEAGNEVRSSPHEMTTPALPSDFPPVDAVQSEPDRMEPGVTLFSVFRRTEDDPGTDFGLILAVNGAGEVVWYYRSDERITDVRRLQNGNILGSPKVRVGHFARLSRGGCSSRLVQQSIIIPMTADAEWKPKARRMITRTLLCSPSTMPLVTPQRM